jgi:hypothetical protein
VEGPEGSGEGRRGVEGAGVMRWLGWRKGGQGRVWIIIIIIIISVKFIVKMKMRM